MCTVITSGRGGRAAERDPGRLETVGVDDVGAGTPRPQVVAAPPAAPAATWTPERRRLAAWYTEIAQDARRAQHGRVEAAPFEPPAERRDVDPDAAGRRTQDLEGT